MTFFYDFAVIGGDLRQYYLAKKLRLSGYSLISYATPTPESMPPLDSSASLDEAVCHARCILAPIPLSWDGVTIHILSENSGTNLTHLIDLLQPNQHFYAGCIPDFFISSCAEKGIFCRDWMKLEEVAQFNSIATAEGTIAKMIQHYPSNLQGLPVLITGFGRCAHTLAQKLKALDCQVTVCARRPNQRFLAQTEGFQSRNFAELPHYIGTFPLIVNTVPAPVFTDPILSACAPDTFFFDIASLPGGIPDDLEKKYSLQIYRCLSLPGLYSPKASGEKLAEIILR